MNNTPEHNTNGYREYNINGQPRPANPQRSAQNPGAVRQAPQQSQNPQNRPQRPVPQSGRQMQPSQQRRPLNDEERRRLEAARMAALQNGGKMTEEEIRRRRREQQQLGAAQPGANPQRRVEIHNPTGSGPQNRTAPQSQMKRKKNKVRINPGAVLFVLLIAGVIGASAYQLTKNDIPLSEKDDIPHSDVIEPEIGGNLSESEPDFTLEYETDSTVSESETAEEVPAEEDINLTLYDTVTVSNETIDEGNLILVNYEYPYADTDTVSLANVYNERKSGVKVATTAISLTADTLTALDNMLFGLTAETGCDDLLINSGYRNTADQQKIYDDYVVDYGPEYAKAYVADAGHSEHHTGLAADLSFFTDDGYLIPVAEHESGWWLGANCADYGFILRYPSEKVDITRISYEAWHFRYVGIPHAYACNAFGYCYEEYISALKNYTADTKVLHVKADGTASDAEIASLPVEGGGWLVYYVPASEGDTTDVKIFRGDLYSNYEISGTNAGGYIVTITLP